MITRDRVRDVIGSTVYGAGHEKIGKVGHVFLDDQTETPQFATVRTGLFGQRETFVPLENAELREGELSVPYDAQKVKAAPNIDIEQGHISQQEEQELYRYYGMGYSTSRSGSGLGEPTTGAEGPEGAAGAAGAAPGRAPAGEMPSPPPGRVPQGETTGRAATGRTAGPEAAGRETAPLQATGRAGAPETAGREAFDAGLIRYEERLRLGTQSVEVGRARLRKHIETEEVRQTIPIRRERVRVEHEPIAEENREQAMRSGPAFVEAEHEVTLHEERPVVEKEQIPVERVRLTKDVETVQHQVSEWLRKERISEELPDEPRRQPS